MTAAPKIRTILTTQRPDPWSSDIVVPGYTTNQLWHVRVLHYGKELQKLHRIFEKLDEALAYKQNLSQHLGEIIHE